MNQASSQVFLIPILADNYVFVLRSESQNHTAVVDPGDAGPVHEFLKERQWKLNEILLTHHHSDHIGGVPSLVATYQCAVTGPIYDNHRINGMTRQVSEGDHIAVGAEEFEIWYMPGHTLGHIAYVSLERTKVFCGDVLFGMGCGRLFEGTPDQMYTSLSRFKNLPPASKIYCTHEYTLKNAEFSQDVLPSNLAVKQRLENTRLLSSERVPTVPLTLREELLTNPFLLAKDIEEFTGLRQRRNSF